MQTLLATHAANLRVDRISPHRWTVWAPSAEAADTLSRTLLPFMDAGREGHEYWRELGEIVFVRVMRKSRDRVRVLSPGYPPRGMFSNLRALERVLTVR